jgi:predicted DNA-binding transcriptional regulator YafY
MDEARRRVSPSVGTLEGADGAVVLRLGGDDLEWIARYLAGLGFGFTVLDPPGLRDAVRAEAERLAACAQALSGEG